MEAAVEPIPLEEFAAEEILRRGSDHASDDIPANMLPIQEEIKQATPPPKSKESEAKVFQDANLPEEHEAFVMERDEQTGLFVPEWWSPPDDNISKFPTQTVEGEPTIFLMIASYRDFQCRDSLNSALRRAKYAARLVIGVVQQNIKEEDESCIDPIESCETNREQLLCKHKSQIKLYEMDAREASGPVYARHVGYRMYRGEAFVMQIDAHVVFVNDWDELILNQWRTTHNEMAVLSTYLSDVKDSVDANGNSKRRTRPIMCNSDFEGAKPARYLRHASQPEAPPAIADQPMLQPFWAAGFSFARGHFLVNVPYDCCLPFVFMGEEISIGIRAWTHGYDLYAPAQSVIFHEYAQNSPRRRKVPKFWEARKDRLRQGDGQRSLKRLTALIGMAPDVHDYDRIHADLYGLGTKRNVSTFYHLFLINVFNRTAQPLCRFVETGAMHKEYIKALRPDGMGIDYSQINFDTQHFLDQRLYIPLVNRLKRQLEKPDRGALVAILNEVSRAKLEQRSPEYAALVRVARNKQVSLSPKP
eukprot:CAMPEP_0197318572 /NCGR_PEP_ID=MMETSP0891-20130614/51640_1 /TAXON_ID=44058 ORGANISM="Aureoumbra lagunensis, Strain CCMP1510" /NCGR_SAMPLE_ID=MMETSP0891 /ASSEMBLY_ACC=CAM_ASM_000534 /LENGTH=530 /DNA_ID=CAMNT_0042809113 /DNA_START=154 /DNA_END=1746 /DNA_ORIENTATION=-